MAVTAFAPAKVNLYLHIIGRRTDGYHLLDSLIAFADIGDRITAEPATTLSLEISGPEASGLTDLGQDNLVLRAARLLADYAGTTQGAALHLEKNLPAAAGIGGGSSDAAAALRVLAALWRLSIEEQALRSIGARLGADLPACLYGRAAWLGGIGERIEPAPELPEAGIWTLHSNAWGCRRLGRGAGFAPQRPDRCRDRPRSRDRRGAGTAPAASWRLDRADERQRRHMFCAVLKPWRRRSSSHGARRKRARLVVRRWRPYCR